MFLGFFITSPGVLLALVGTVFEGASQLLVASCEAVWGLVSVPGAIAILLVITALHYATMPAAPEPTRTELPTPTPRAPASLEPAQRPVSLEPAQRPASLEPEPSRPKSPRPPPRAPPTRRSSRPRKARNPGH